MVANTRRHGRVKKTVTVNMEVGKCATKGWDEEWQGIEGRVQQILQDVWPASLLTKGDGSGDVGRKI